MFALLVLAVLPSPLVADEVLIRGLVSHNQQDDYAIYGAVITNGSTSNGYVLLFNADFDYYFATITTSPQAAARSPGSHATGSASQQGQPGANHSPSPGATNRNQATGQPPSGNSSAAPQKPSGTGTGQTAGPNSSTKGAGSGTPGTNPNAASQGPAMNLVGVIVASSERSAENTTLKALVSPATGVIVVTTGQGTELTGKGFVTIRPKTSTPNSTPPAAGTTSQPMSK
jgi:hypothetical protein